MSPHHLVGASEIGELLGVTRQRIDQLAKEPGFPAPTVELAAGRVWVKEDVEEWARATGREIKAEA